MRIIKMNVFKSAYYDKDSIICITTNGFIKRNGCGVMGAGIALEAKSRITHLEKILGNHIKNNGNNVGFLLDNIIAFPVKKSWMMKAELELIEKSANQLREIALDKKDKTFYLPAPGIGNGRLEWNEVKPIIEKILPENVVIVSLEELM